MTDLKSELLSRGVVIVDKPSGMTSRQVVDKIKKILSVKKAGHCGTLDPKVTGVLLVVLEEATKATYLLMGLNKEYEGVMYLHRDVELKKVRKAAKDFVGEILQKPPVKSAVARKLRKRKVYFFKILKKDGKNVYFRTKVEAGTYIRKLCSDMGKKLGVGAHMKSLRRTGVGHFSIKNSHTIDKIKKTKSLNGILIPIEKAILHVKKIRIKSSAVQSVHHGAPIKIQHKMKENETVAIFSNKKLIAWGLVQPNRKIRIKRVFMF